MRRLRGDLRQPDIALASVTTAEPNIAEQRGKIKLLEDAPVLADDLGDGTMGYLVERALDEARSRQFIPK